MKLSKKSSLNFLIAALLCVPFALIACSDSGNDAVTPAPVTPGPVVVEQDLTVPILNCKATATNEATQLDKPIVIMVSIDGFRADYVQKYKPANILKIIKKGIYTTGLIPSYPTSTFPNHFTLATGRYPGHHGIVSNNFYDHARKETYDAFNSKIATDSSWYQGDPIWNVVQRAGMVSYTMDWVGSEAHVNGVDPTCYTKYNESVTFANKVNETFRALSLPKEQRPHFIGLYDSVVDTVGHAKGTESAEVQAAIKNVDVQLGRLWDYVRKSDLPINLVIVADHGMQNLDPEKVIYLEDYIPTADLATFKTSDRGAAMMLYNDDPVKIKAAYDALKANEKNFKVYLKGQTPDKFKLVHPSRTGDIIVMADIPYYTVSFHPMPGTKINLKAGNHGWSFENKEMHALFVAAGHNIEANRTVPPFKNIDVYPFVLNILGAHSNMDFDGDESTLSPYIITDYPN